MSVKRLVLDLRSPDSSALLIASDAAAVSDLACLSVWRVYKKFVNSLLIGLS